MKHLLSSIESSGLRLESSESDIRQLLTHVRDSRDNKSAENFYESLEKVLAELRSTEHSAPFLKAVRRNEAPGYDIIIKNPMDLGTMSKKVKSHAYKNKKEFADDLNLIWDNCLTYNSDPAHPLRRSTVFMRKKADQAVERVFDRNERLPPVILPSNGVSHRQITPPLKSDFPPRDLGATRSPIIRIKLGNLKTLRLTNGNGVHEHPPEDIVPQTNGSVHTLSGDTAIEELSPNKSTPEKPSRSPTPALFHDEPAIVRTQQSMQQFRELDIAMQRHLDSEGAGPSRLAQSSSYPSSHATHFGDFTPDDGSMTVRQKLKAAVESDDRHGGRIAREIQERLGSTPQEKRPLLNGSDTSGQSPRKKRRFNLDTSPPDLTGVLEDGELLGSWWAAVGNTSLLAGGLPIIPPPPKPKPRHGPSGVIKSLKRNKAISPSSPRKGLKGIIYKNVDTLRRVRRIHSTILTMNSSPNPSFENTDQPHALRLPDAPPAAPPDILMRPPPIPLEGGSVMAENALRSNCTMLLEHAGFESGSRAALEVLNDVAADFIMNLGRSMRFLSDQCSRKMTPEEIVLHTLFDAGTTQVQELERYIKDDVERYGSRLSEVERKLDQAYKDNLEAEADAVEDDMLFQEDGDALITGDFTEALGEDFFGLKELGLDKELGLSSLTIPSRLFHGRGKKKDSSAAGALAGEPLPPFPPPPPFVPLESRKVEAQIGLLQPYYKDKFVKLVASTMPIAPVIPTTVEPVPAALPLQTPPLPDDPPNPSKIKMGPLGQVTPVVTTVAKKKSKGGTGTGGSNPSGKTPPPPVLPLVNGKKKKGKKEKGGADIAP